MNDDEILGPVLPDEDQTTKRIMHLITSLTVTVVVLTACIILLLNQNGN